METSEAFKSATTTASPAEDSTSAPAYAELGGRGENGGNGGNGGKSGAGQGDEETEVHPRKLEKKGVARAGIEPATHGFSVEDW
jgi:hypothetical protein